MADSDTTTQTTQTTQTTEANGAPPEAPEQPQSPDELGDAGKRAIAAERKLRSEAEKAAKASQAELDKLRSQTMSEQEKAVSAARDEGRLATLKEVGVKLVEADIRVAAAGRPVDLDALIEGVDASKFLDADGNPDREAIAGWVDRVAPQPEPASAPTPELGARRRGPVNTGLSGDPLESDLRRKLGM